MTSSARPSAPSSPVDDDGIDLLVRRNDDIVKSNLTSKRHTRLVRLMRLILPVAALAVVAVLMTWKSDQAPLTPVPREKISPQTVTQNELVKPKFQSEDMNNNPYTITADKATQTADDKDTIVLEKPVADMMFKSGSRVTVLSMTGSYKQTDGRLVLDKGVEMKDDSGYSLRTERMDVDVKNQTLRSSTSVSGTGPAGTVEAAGLEADGSAKIITFNGPAKLTLIHHKE